MRILLPTFDAPDGVGGVSRYVDAIAKTFPDNVRVVHVTNEQLSRLFWNEYHNYDVMWIHHVLPIGTRAWLNRLIGSHPYVIFLHGLDFDLARRNPWKRWLLRRILRNAQHVVANSQALAGEVEHFARIKKPLVVYPCVDDALVAAAQAIPLSRHPAIPLRLLTVGRLVRRKGHLTVLDAIKDNTRFSYDIVGDGEMRHEIEEKITAYGLQDRVRLHTNVNHDALPDFYRNADLFVMPSHKSATDREGFGIVYLEAALFGLPVIAVRQPGVDEAIVDGVTGVLIEDSCEDLKRALTQMTSDHSPVQRDRALCATLGEQGRARVLAEFTREKQFGRLRALL